MIMGDWTCADGGGCDHPCNTDARDYEALIAAAERAYAFLKDFHGDNQREVIFELEDALGIDGGPRNPE